MTTQSDELKEPVVLDPPRRASWLGRFFLRWRAMAGIAISMMFYDKSKLAAGLVGVIFSTVLAGQQSGTFMGLLSKNTMLIDHGGADIWIVPPGTQQPQPGKRLSERVLYQARSVPGVKWASPVLWVPGSIDLPEGGTEQVSVLGIELPTDNKSWHLGPWNIVAGRREDLNQPDAMFFEDADREKFGGLNMGSVREVNGKRVQAIGFTWGLLPFAPSFGFASYEKAREIGSIADRSQNYVLVGVNEGEDPKAVVARLRSSVSGVDVWTAHDFKIRTIKWVVVRTGIGITLGTSTVFGLIVGFVIVSIAMFSAVVDHIREFGTLKAIGAKMSDLAKILFVQSVCYALMGSCVGIAQLGFVLRGMRSPNLTVLLPAPMLMAVPVVVMVLCILASSLALLRLRKVEPGIVFRA